MVEWYSIVYIYHIYFIHSSVNGHLHCFHFLACVNSAAMNLGVHVSFQIRVFSFYMPRSWIAGSYCSSIFIYFSFYAPAAYGSSQARVWIRAAAEACTIAAATLDPSHIRDLCHSLPQCWILNSLSEARDQTQRPHGDYVLFITCWPIFSFLRDLHAVLQSGGANLHSHQ